MPSIYDCIVYDNVSIFDSEGFHITTGFIADLGDGFHDYRFIDDCGNMHTLSPLSYEYRVNGETICPYEIGTMALAWKHTA